MENAKFFLNQYAQKIFCFSFSRPTEYLGEWPRYTADRKHFIVLEAEQMYISQGLKKERCSFMREAKRIGGQLKSN